MKVEWHEAAVGELHRLDRGVRERVRRVLHDELPRYPDPRERLEPYRGPLKGYWKLRVGDWRLICALERDGGEDVLFVVMIAHRREAYSSKNQRSVARRR